MAAHTFSSWKPRYGEAQLDWRLRSPVADPPEAAREYPPHFTQHPNRGFVVTTSGITSGVIVPVGADGGQSARSVVPFVLTFIGFVLAFALTIMIRQHALHPLTAGAAVGTTESDAALFPPPPALPAAAANASASSTSSSPSAFEPPPPTISPPDPPQTAAAVSASANKAARAKHKAHGKKHHRAAASE